MMKNGRFRRISAPIDITSLYIFSTAAVLVRLQNIQRREIIIIITKKAKQEIEIGSNMRLHLFRGSPGNTQHPGAEKHAMRQ